MLVSVVIPCFNVEEYVAECLESVLRQTYENIEIIAVDNNSTDRTLVVLEDYRRKFPDKIQIVKEKKQGASFARNTGMKMAKGEWIQFLDADDLIFPEKISDQLKLATKEISFIVGTPIYRDVNSKEVIVYPNRDPFKGLAVGLLLGNTSSNLWNRKVLIQIGGWNESLSNTQDTELMYRLLENKGQVVFDLKPNTIHRERAKGQISRQDPIGILISHIHLRKKLTEFLKKEKSDYFAENEAFFQNAVFRFIRMLANLDVGLACEVYREVMPPDFKPKFFPEINTPRISICLTGLFGFCTVESWKTLIKKWVPTNFWNKLRIIWGVGKSF